MPLACHSFQPSPARHARTAAQFFWQQFPGDAAPEHKGDAGQDLPGGAAGVDRRAAGRFGRQQQFQHRPRRLIQNGFCHRRTCQRFRALQGFVRHFDGSFFLNYIVYIYIIAIRHRAAKIIAGLAPARHPRANYCRFFLCNATPHFHAVRFWWCQCWPPHFCLAARRTDN